jgi:cyclopropane fatty-acyl-phospholipid synthase-like methyltransferase
MCADTAGPTLEARPALSDSGGEAALQPESQKVKQYYEDNTRLFLSLGQGSEGTIHRAVWAPGVKNRAEAMAYPDRLVLERLERLARPESGEPLHVVDLGCGVCASLCRLAKQAPITGTGITLSPKQAAFAQQRIEAEGLAGRVRCLEGDFSALPAGLPAADMAFAIESFVHAPDAARFFAEASKLVRPGGYLIVLDDLLTSSSLPTDPKAKGWLERFRRGWLAFNLKAQDEANQLAADVGFKHVETVDLTPYLEIRRRRDYAIGALMRCFGWLPIMGNYWSMLYGGHANQVSVKRGWIKYLFVVWQRT